MRIVELSEKQVLRREEAARRLHEIADELASGNGIVVERGDKRFDVAVPDEVTMKVEVEIESDERELEIELTW
jgi:amphi-Trp domain-containing protein